MKNYTITVNGVAYNRQQHRQQHRDPREALKSSRLSRAKYSRSLPMSETLSRQEILSLFLSP